MSYAIYHDLVIKSTSKEVFAAITSPIHLVNWWPLKCTGKPKKGEIYNFNFTEEYDWYGLVTKTEANKSFHIKMTHSDENWQHTSFGFDLDERDGLVSIRFSHINWPDCNTEFRRSSFCWAMLLKGLKDYLEKGVIIPFENRE